MEDVAAYHVDVNGTVTVSANNVIQQIGVEQTAAVNRTTDRFRQTLEQSVRGQTITLESYLVNGTLYSASQLNVQRYGAEWTKNDLADNDSDPLERGDLLTNHEEYLTNATLAVEGATTVAGTPVYRLRADVNESVFGDSQPILDQLGNVTTDHAEATYFVSRADGTLQRIQLEANLTVESGQTSQDLAIGQTIDLAYEPVSVTLPEAADGAVDISDNSGDDSDESDGTDDDSTDDGSDGPDDSKNSDDGTDGIEVRDGDLAVDPDRTFQRVEQVLATNVTEPASVVAQGPANLTSGDDGTDRRTLGGVMGLESVSLAGTNVTFGEESVPLAWLAEGRVDGVGNVYLHNAPEMPTGVARLLTAHEFVHYVQLQNQRFSAVNSVTDATTDGSYASRATTEGAAVFTTDRLIERYAPDGARNVELYDGIAAAVPDGSANEFRNSWYVSGNRYVDARIDDPAALASVYENPPRTSEEVLHQLAPGSEPPVPLSVDVRTGSEYVLAGSDRKGEAYTRHVLANGVTIDRASRAVAGWGNDTVRILRPADGEGNTSYVWLHRWDDRENASEFADAARAYLDDFGTTEDGMTTLNNVPVTFERLADRTTVFVVGPESLQESVSISADGERVVVETY